MERAGAGDRELERGARQHASLPNVAAHEAEEKGK